MYVHPESHVYTANEFYPAAYLATTTRTLGAYQYTFDNGLQLLLPANIELYAGDEVKLYQPVRALGFSDINLAEVLGVIYAYHVAVGNSHVLYIPFYEEADFQAFVAAAKRAFEKYIKQPVDIFYDAKTKTVQLDYLFALLKERFNWTIDKVFNVMYTFDIRASIAFFKPFITVLDEYNRGYGLRFTNHSFKMYLYNLLVRLGTKPVLKDEYMYITEKDMEALKDLAVEFNLPFKGQYAIRVVSKDFVGYRTFVYVPDELVRAIDGIAVNGLTKHKEVRIKFRGGGRVQVASRRETEEARC